MLCHLSSYKQEIQNAIHANSFLLCYEAQKGMPKPLR